MNSSPPSRVYTSSALSPLIAASEIPVAFPLAMGSTVAEVAVELTSVTQLCTPQLSDATQNVPLMLRIQRFTPLPIRSGVAAVPAARSITVSQPSCTLLPPVPELQDGRSGKAQSLEKE